MFEAWHSLSQPETAGLVFILYLDAFFFETSFFLQLTDIPYRIAFASAWLSDVCLLPVAMS